MPTRAGCFQELRLSAKITSHQRGTQCSALVKVVLSHRLDLINEEVFSSLDDCGKWGLERLIPSSPVPALAVGMFILATLLWCARDLCIVLQCRDPSTQHHFSRKKLFQPRRELCKLSISGLSCSHVSWNFCSLG